VADESDRLLVTGDYYLGAFGPTIILVLASPAGAAWLEDEFRLAARAERPRNLLDDHRIEVRQISALTLDLRESGADVELRRIGDESPTFLWTATKDGWQRLADLLKPLSTGQNGHQYLTREGVDDALIEVSLGEHDGRA